MGIKLIRMLCPCWVPSFPFRVDNDIWYIFLKFVAHAGDVFCFPADVFAVWKSIWDLPRGSIDCMGRVGIMSDYFPVFPQIISQLPSILLRWWMRVGFFLCVCIFMNSSTSICDVSVLSVIVVLMLGLPYLWAGRLSQVGFKSSSNLCSFLAFCLVCMFQAPRTLLVQIQSQNRPIYKRKKMKKKWPISILK